MKMEIVHIGVVDDNDFVHSVPFCPGLNVITGRSSTGKSALIEIVDYCMGSSSFTIPEGKITDCTAWYFIVVKIEESIVVIARSADPKKCFLKKIVSDENLDVESLSLDYFTNANIFPETDFKKELKKYFGENLSIESVDESVTEEMYRRSKKPTPSVRSFASYMFQHQGLVANKHAIFYRFEQREKREQAIEHFKIFMGFVDQKYFILKQELEELKSKQRRLEHQKPKIKEIKDRYISKLETAINEFEAFSGMELGLESLEEVLKAPTLLLDRLLKLEIKTKSGGSNYTKYSQKIDNKLRELEVKYRLEELNFKKIQSSIRSLNEYLDSQEKSFIYSNVDVPRSECPFCGTHNSTIVSSANALSDAIEWLNNELQNSHYMLPSLEKKEKDSADKLCELNTKIQRENKKALILRKYVKDLQRGVQQLELALRAKINVENLLYDFINAQKSNIDQELEGLKLRITDINNQLKGYAVDQKLKRAETVINKTMNEVAKNLDFEDYYKNGTLKFSLESFDLWIEVAADKSKKKVFLRSMGSGANWLSCHIALFLGLLKCFCAYSGKCSLPTLVFFDQPSQVYFPSAVDTGQEFLHKELAGFEKKTDEEADADLEAVRKLYEVLDEFCITTFCETDIMPQIIVTDHADNLTLYNSSAFSGRFEDLVGGRRWRSEKQGFIKETD
ncbi:DUF3732 domain-containing protein [Maridesulfovibrio sp.]|uniref:DUF3732 domain-containing protein n=1 Tax=Maridesulfovibrio sp. TaxID=2795000 RepID=UPI0029C9CC06|nr:DUF3732 domain-containing protein [Maridesulfovibrio sp.]